MKINLKNLRIDRGLTQQQLADDLGINQSIYARYESGKLEMNYKVMFKIAKYFNVTLDELLGR